MPQDASDGYERLTDIATAAKNEGSEVTHVIRDVVRNYSELTSDMRDFYEKNLKKFPESAERTANDLYNLTKTFHDDVHEFANSMINISPPAKISGYNISKIFANSAFLLLVSSIFLFIGSYITAPAFGIIFLNFGAIIVATIVIPLISSYVYHNLKVRSLAEKRIACVGFIFLQSVLIGFINQNDWLETAPFTVMTQIISSFVYPLVLAHTDNRQKILSIVGGTSMLCHVAHAIFFSGSNGAFLTIAILYTLLAIALIQYSIAFHTNQTDFDMMHLSMQYVFLVSIVKMFALMSFGSDK